ncbi:ribosomal protein L12 [Ordospora colligata]|uniref:Ribosomal protein L12 n=1 Tax=Ordospora colligata OC4 TaxID=1354746 RepID=A0A0B2UJZ1_9MICR|nr:ribosomal protein L12 [Ordospora colligata OC4]KHN69260.1 ribosomal protein L12 [Ordospora colligata OC4]TBU14438.1 ribosomal protein L12 [Ordospora colligata]TBU14715.1 ribosomal protein L12 [Ordospora colligata]TBU18100.1 ribosomal protein L12 [Ordospora colligata]
MNTQKVLDPDTKYIKLRVIGGELPGATLAQKVGPLGLSSKVVGEDIKKATSDYKSLRVHVELAIKDRKATVEIQPSVSTLVIKALKEAPRDRKKEKNILHSGSIKMIEVVEIARLAKSTRSFSRTLTGAVKEVLGTCKAIGCKVDGKCPKEVIHEINTGDIKLPDQ